MPDRIKRLCPICRDAEIELTPCRSGCLSIKASPLAMAEDYLEAEIYVCPRCRYAAFFAPPMAAEEFEQTFRDYTEKQLQKVIDGRDYVPDAKKAAKNLLYRRKYGE